MSPPRHEVNDQLETWEALRAKYRWSGLLIGNGASQAIWEDFRYSSLYDTAHSVRVSRSLTREDRTIFEAFQTTNFERVLNALWTAEIVTGAINRGVPEIRKHYERVREALVEAVHAVHVPYHLLPEETLTHVRSALMGYKHVYSTNYDLLAYWAIMSKPDGRLKEYFWADDAFDMANTALYSGSSDILYLHGALHLVHLPSGRTRKLTASAASLLDQFDQGLGMGEIPLFVSEGTADDKLASIYRSNYLSFAYGRFLQHQGSLVVFGHSLADSDQHIMRAIRQWRKRLVAVSIRRGDPKAIVARKAALHEQLPEANLLFFDAATHPLGKSDLQVVQEQDAEVLW